MIKVNKLKYFIVTKLPGLNGNAYSGSKRLYESIKVKDDNIIYSYYPTNEGIDWQVEYKEKGGVIVLSTDVNAKELSPNKLINWFKQKSTALKNRVNKNKIIDKVANGHKLIGWTVGKFLNGRYRSKSGVNFGENSLSIEIIGVTTTELISIAEDLYREFVQETVLVKDYATGNIYFVNPNKEES